MDILSSPSADLPPDLPPDLPVTEVLPALVAALASAPNAILIAPPGAGKTTLVPLALRQAPWCSGRILMLEPRRLAARAAAQRMAQLCGEKAGQSVGFRTRFDHVVSRETSIEVITEGLLTARLLADPGLEGVACVIFDEIHERSLEGDLALALTLDLQSQLRPDLRILAMSATPDAASLQPILNGTMLTSQGTIFPLTIEHAKRDIASAKDLPVAMAQAIRAALSAHPGDILAFLPGMAEIRRTERELSGCGVTILPLHGDLPPAAQDLALSASAQRRVVLATLIAETSLTVPGVRIVIDGGYRRAPRLDAASGLTRLATLRISKAAADQRAGRAARQGPGVAIRLWSSALHRGLPGFDQPEILAADLARLVLACAAWGTAPAQLRFADPPPAGALAASRALLAALGALEGDQLTNLGARMAQMGAAPRLAAMLLAAQTPGQAALAADLAAILEERDILRGLDQPADIVLRLDALAGRVEADRGAVARARQVAGQYRARLGLKRDEAAMGDPGLLIAAGFPDRIAQRRGEPGSFRLSGGGSAKLPLGDPFGKAGLLAVAGLHVKDSARITLASLLDADDLPQALKARCTITRETGFDGVSGSVLVRERVRLGVLVLSDRASPASAAETEAALAKALASRLDQLDWSDNVQQFCARVALMAGIEPGWPDLSRAALAARIDEWLAPHLVGCRSLADAAKLDLLAILRGMLSYQQAASLDRDLPAWINLPGGRAMIDYLAPIPTAAARAQAFYGQDSTPLLAGGRIKLNLSLLSPAQRPIATTADLAGFWRGGWADARRDMRGRYPRHDWPEQPWLAPAKPAHRR